MGDSMVVVHLPFYICWVGGRHESFNTLFSLHSSSSTLISLSQMLTITTSILAKMFLLEHKKLYCLSFFFTFSNNLYNKYFLKLIFLDFWINQTLSLLLLYTSSYFVLAAELMSYVL